MPEQPPPTIARKAQTGPTRADAGFTLKARIQQNLRGARLGALIAVLTGLLLWNLPIGYGLVHWSYDIPVILGPTHSPQEIVIIKMDEQSHDELKQEWLNWSRAFHARLLRKLTADGARLVVFDVFFPQSEPKPEDPELAQAIRESGRVILAGVYSPMAGFKGGTVLPPIDAFREAAGNGKWGVSNVEVDSDPAIRRHYPGTDEFPSLPWAAATTLDAPITKLPASRYAERWMRYYGTDGTLPSVSYYLALEKPAGYFKDKIVFIGGKPITRHVREEVDEFHTPYTHAGGPFMGGVEVEATTLLNLIRNDWLRKMPTGLHVALIVVCGALFGFGLSLLRPLPGAAIAAAGMTLITVAACVLAWKPGVWFYWLFIVAAQIPCAWACAATWHLQKLYQEKAALEARVAAAGLTSQVGTAGTSSPAAVVSAIGYSPGVSPGSAPPAAPPASETRGIAVIPDHAVLRAIGRGAYGEVYLARNAIGMFQAVKVIYRHGFKDEAPYEREFRGIQKYMPISRNHPSLVNLLHVGRNDQAGYFYYIMELGDDESGMTKIDPFRYSPRNLAKDLKKRGPLPVAECVQLSLALAGALDYLHREQLIHRDIKPSNIIFVRGVPKFADIGLVTDIASDGQDVTYIGTEGYIAPEGPGTPAADVYSLGMVLYEAATGMDRHRFPELPDTLTRRPDSQDLLRLNRIILNACQHDPKQRYQTAGTMHDDLQRLQPAAQS